MARISFLVATLFAAAGTCLGVSVERRTPDNSMLQYANDGVRYLGDWKWDWQPMTGSACSRSHHTSIVGAGVEMQFKGASLSILGSFSNHPRLNITLDGVSETYPTGSTTPGQPASVAYPCMSFWEKKNLKDGDHLVSVQILPETDDATTAGGEFYFNGFQVDAGLVTPSSPAQPLATTSAASSSSSSGTGSVRPDTLVIGIVVGVVLFALFTSLLVAFLVYRHRRNQRAAMAEKIGVQTNPPAPPPAGGLGKSEEGGDAVFGYTNEKGEAVFETKSDVDWDARSRRSSASTLVPVSSFPAKSFKMLFTTTTPK